jgi:hypothetical protein
MMINRPQPTSQTLCVELAFPSAALPAINQQLYRVLDSHLYRYGQA